MQIQGDVFFVVPIVVFTVGIHMIVADFRYLKFIEIKRVKYLSLM